MATESADLTEQVEKAQAEDQTLGGDDRGEGTPIDDRQEQGSPEDERIVGEDEAPEEDEGPEEDDDPTLDDRSPKERRGARRRVLLSAGLCVVLVLAMVVCAVLGFLRYGSHQETADRAAATDAARKVTEQLVTVNAQNAPAHINVMLARSADPFRQQLTGITKVFEQILKQGQVSADGAVSQVGIESIGDGHARALVNAGTLVHNTQTPQGAQRTYRLAVGLVQVDGDWRVSSVDVAS